MRVLMNLGQLPVRITLDVDSKLRKIELAAKLNTEFRGIRNLS